jgi:hypothetical protein
MCEDFAPNFGGKRTDCCITTVHRLAFRFSPENCCLSVLPYSTLLFPRLKIKLKGRRFDTTEVVEAEPHAVLNTLTEHGFKLWERCIRAEGNYFEADGGQQGPKLVFDQMAAPVREITSVVLCAEHAASS